MVKARVKISDFIYGTDEVYMCYLAHNNIVLVVHVIRSLRVLLGIHSAVFYASLDVTM